MGFFSVCCSHQVCCDVATLFRVSGKQISLGNRQSSVYPSVRFVNVCRFPSLCFLFFNYFCLTSPVSLSLSLSLSVCPFSVCLSLSFVSSSLLSASFCLFFSVCWLLSWQDKKKLRYKSPNLKTVIPPCFEAAVFRNSNRKSQSNVDKENASSEMWRLCRISVPTVRIMRAAAVFCQHRFFCCCSGGFH